jgi:hypothetical protein
VNLECREIWVEAVVKCEMGDRSCG